MELKFCAKSCSHWWKSIRDDNDVIWNTIVQLAVSYYKSSFLFIVAFGHRILMESSGKDVGESGAAWDKNPRTDFEAM